MAAARTSSTPGISRNPSGAGVIGPRRDARVFVYAGIDLVMACIYAYLLFVVVPSRHGWVALMSGLIAAAPVAMAAAMLLRRAWSWWLGVAACGLLLILAVTFLVLTLLSAAFLAGVYGSIGQAASLFALIGAALVIELVALLPAFQLKYLMTRAGRRAFGLEPLWA